MENDILSRIQFEQAVKTIKANESIFIEQCHLVANYLSHYYKALTDKGFTSEQALQIAIAHGINFGRGNN